MESLTIQQKLIIIQEKLEAPKGQWNSFSSFHYRSCEDILGALGKYITELGVFITLDDEILLIGDRYYVKATATISDMSGAKISTSAYAREPLDKKGMDSAQVTGATSSYARKYALGGLFKIDDSKDADTQDNKSPENRPQPNPINNGPGQAPKYTTNLASDAQLNALKKLNVQHDKNITKSEASNLIKAANENRR